MICCRSLGGWCEHLIKTCPQLSKRWHNPWPFFPDAQLMSQLYIPKFPQVFPKSQALTATTFALNGNLSTQDPRSGRVEGILAGWIWGRCILHACCHSHLPQPKPNTDQHFPWQEEAWQDPAQTPSHGSVLGTRAYITELRGTATRIPAHTTARGPCKVNQQEEMKGHVLMPRSWTFWIKVHSLGSVTVMIQDPVTLSILGQEGIDCWSTEKAFFPEDR